MLLFILIGSVIAKDSLTLTPNQIQGRLNIVNGYAAECVMHNFYRSTGWIQIEGEIGRNGIDGLYYKKKNGVIREVLVAESKWNTSKLGLSGKGRTVKQMSQEWVLRTLSRLQKHKPIPEYSSIEKLVKNGIYRARLFRLKPVGEDSIRITIYKIRNKGMKQFDTFVESTLHPISIRDPQNSFEKRIVNAYNSCRTEALHKYFPMLDGQQIERLMDDSYLKKRSLTKILNRRDLRRDPIKP